MLSTFTMGSLHIATAAQTKQDHKVFNNCCCGIHSSVSLFSVFPCTFWAIVWNISQVLANEVDTADKLFPDLWAERGLAGRLTSSQSVLHVDVQKNSVVVCPNVSLSFAYKKQFSCVVVQPSHLNCYENILLLTFFKVWRRPCKRQDTVRLCCAFLPGHHFVSKRQWKWITIRRQGTAREEQRVQHLSSFSISPPAQHCLNLYSTVSVPTPAEKKQHAAAKMFSRIQFYAGHQHYVISTEIMEFQSPFISYFIVTNSCFKGEFSSVQQCQCMNISLPLGFFGTGVVGKSCMMTTELSHIHWHNVATLLTEKEIYEVIRKGGLCPPELC